jgi:hypothetical protein
MVSGEVEVEMAVWRKATRSTVNLVRFVASDSSIWTYSEVRSASLVQQSSLLV